MVGTLARLAQKYNKRVRVICGDSVLSDRDLGILGIESLVTLVSIAGDRLQSINEPRRFLKEAVKQSM